MLIEAAIGDAYGAGFEYADPGFVEKYNDIGKGYIQHSWHHDLKPGCYTDDTQMSLGIAELLISEKPWTPENLAQKFVEVFHRDKRPGYAKGYDGFIREIRDGSQFLRGIRSHSEKNGAAMRSAPIGVLPTIAEVIEKSSIQARITHDTEIGTNAAIAVSLMTHYFLNSLGRKEDLGAFLEENVPGEWSLPWTGNVGPLAFQAVRAAITAIRNSDSLSSLLKACIAFSGDVDTVATIALAAGSCCGEIRSDLPAILYDNLENGTFGRDYLSATDRALLALHSQLR